ncbi:MULTISPECIES: hypothetical protein [Burkholderia]|uniref:hypothetical protein n=1 Tax=Burkholderia sp. GbtcB21 TaxID=2824766 RepID=UPI001C2FF390|nr:hypothetical protein [Burkholderia sp. GbtcB21]
MNTSGNARGPQIFHSTILAVEYPVRMPRLHSLHIPVGRVAGELFRDQEVSDGENLRDRRPNSIAVSFFSGRIFTLARHSHEIGPGAGGLCGLGAGR